MAYPETGGARRSPSKWLATIHRANGGEIPWPTERGPSGFPDTQDSSNKFDLRTEDGLAAAKQKLQAVGLSPTITISPPPQRK